MHTISLLQTSNFDKQIYQDYSRFKHGSKNIARKFGKDLANKIKNEGLFLEKESLVFYPAPFNNIPTASGRLFLRPDEYAYITTSVTVHGSSGTEGCYG